MGFVTRIEAEQLHAEWLDSLFNPKEKNNAAEAVSLEKAISVYLDYLSGRGSTYWKDVNRMLTRLSKVVGASTRLDQIDVSQAREFQRRIVAAGAGLSTADRHVAMAKAMYSYCAPDTPNPFKRVDMYHPDNLVIRLLSPDEESRLLDAAKSISDWRLPWVYHYVLIAMRTGLRKQNILRLRWDEVEMNRQRISVRQKGNRRHAVPMASDVIDLLRSTTPTSEWCFPNKDTGRPYWDFKRKWAHAKRLAQVDSSFRFHDLRHHVASRLMSATRNPLIVQSVLGHSDIRITQRYMHAWQSEMSDAVETLVQKKTTSAK
jgi:integrase